jgi:transglutaminase superfamily protein
MARMILRALKLATRDPARAWLTTRMAWWVALLSVLARVLPLPQALRIVSATVRPGLRGEAADQKRFASAIDGLLATDFLVFKPSCWKRSVVLHRFFALSGVATTIRFGVRKETEGGLKGHAWLELDGKPILESSPPNYSVTYTFPSAETFEGELALMAGTRD